MSIKHNLFGEQIVPGNLKDALQVYNMYYYPPEKDYPSSKLRLYFNRKEENRYKGSKSLCFRSIENHRNFIIKNILAELYWLQQQGFKPETMQSRIFQEELLNAMFRDIRKKIIQKIKEGKITEIRNKLLQKWKK